MFSDAYWERSVGESNTDWLCSYGNLQSFVQPFLVRPRSTALVLGSGTSSFPEEIYDRWVLHESMQPIGAGMH